MAIREWPADERPRERLLARGAAGLSDAELLAIFLRTGLPGLSAVDLARQLLTRFGSLRGLLGADREAFCAERGLGEAKYAQLQAVLELARRHLGETLGERDLLREPALVRQYLASRLREGDRERFVGLFLDSQNRLIASEVLAEGSLHEASVYPREVVKTALRLGAASVIFAHNHPSGVPEPSEADRRLTERLRQALATVDVRVLDHFVVGEGAPLSFSERGLL